MLVLRTDKQVCIMDSFETEDGETIPYYPSTTRAAFIAARKLHAKTGNEDFQDSVDDKDSIICDDENEINLENGLNKNEIDKIQSCQKESENVLVDQQQSDQADKNSSPLKGKEKSSGNKKSNQNAFGQTMKLQESVTATNDAQEMKESKTFPISARKASYKQPSISDATQMRQNPRRFSKQFNKNDLNIDGEGKNVQSNSRRRLRSRGGYASFAIPEKLSSFEALSSQFHAVNHNTNVKRGDDALQKVQEQLATANSQCHSLETVLQSTQAELALERKELKNAKEKQLQLQSLLEQKDRELSNFRQVTEQKSNQLSARLKDCEVECANMKQNFSQSEKENEKSRCLYSSSINTLESKIQKEKTINEEYRSQLHSLEATAFSLQQQLSDYEAKYIELTKAKNKAAEMADAHENASHRMMKRMTKALQVAEKAKQIVRGYQIILKRVVVKAFVRNFLMKKRLRALLQKLFLLGSTNLEEFGYELNHNADKSVQEETADEIELKLQTRKQILGSVTSSTTGLILIDHLHDEMDLFCDTQAHIHSYRKRWMETSNALFRRNIELTNLIIEMDSKIQQADKRVAAISLHCKKLVIDNEKLQENTMSLNAARAQLQHQIMCLEQGAVAQQHQARQEITRYFDEGVIIKRRLDQAKKNLQDMSEHRAQLKEQIDRLLQAKKNIEGEISTLNSIPLRLTRFPSVSSSQRNLKSAVTKASLTSRDDFCIRTRTHFAASSPESARSSSNSIFLTPERPTAESHSGTIVQFCE